MPQLRVNHITATVLQLSNLCSLEGRAGWGTETVIIDEEIVDPKLHH